MAAPVIDTKTSVLALTEGQIYTIQLTATNSPTTWAISSGALPSGLTLETSEGKITGTPDLDAAGAVYSLQITATNSSSETSNPMTITIGVERNAFELSAATEIDINLRTGKASMPNVEMGDEGKMIFHAKSGDIMPVTIGLMKDGYSQDINVNNINFYAKEYEPETLYRITNGVMRKVGSGVGCRYQCMLDFSAAALETVLSNYEEDAGTYVDMVAEIQIDFQQDVGTNTSSNSVKTSQNFILRLSRDLG